MPWPIAISPLIGKAILATLLAAAAIEPAYAEPPSGGWRQSEASLLLFSDGGKLMHEIGLGDWREEIDGDRVRRYRMQGNALGGGRFAWHWQRVDTIEGGRVERVTASTTTLVYLGRRGQLLWQNNLADTPGEFPPLMSSLDGETALVLERRGAGWRVASYAFTGNRGVTADLGERLQRLRLTDSGRYVMALHSGIDEPLLYTFLDTKTGAREDIRAADTLLGRAKIDDAGIITLGDGKRRKLE